jgi:hypothetical protein
MQQTNALGQAAAHASSRSPAMPCVTLAGQLFTQGRNCMPRSHSKLCCLQQHYQTRCGCSRPTASPTVSVNPAASSKTHLVGVLWVQAKVDEHMREAARESGVRRGCMDAAGPSRASSRQICQGPGHARQVMRHNTICNDAGAAPFRQFRKCNIGPAAS